jgi:hypothetical protein
MRHGFMATPIAMMVLRIMTLAACEMVATVGVGFVHGDHVLLDFACFLMAKMAVMDVVDMAVVLNCSVTTSWTVRMRMLRSF